MKNKFNIFDLFFRTKRKKEKIKGQEKKEKEQIIINNKNNVDEYFVDPFIPPIPFFTEENKLKKKKDETIDKPKITIPVKDDTKKELKEENNTILKNEEITITTTAVDNIVPIEKAIIDEVEKNIKEDLYELNKIKYELEIIKKEEEKELKLEEINNLIIQLDKLIKRFEKVKKEFYKKNYDKIDFDFNNSAISDLIEEYIIYIKNNNIASDSLIQIRQIEEYIDIINNLVSIEEDSHILNNDLTNKKETLNIKDKELDDFDKKYTNIDKITKYIDTFSKEQETIIKEIENKVNQSTKITKKAEYQTNLIIDYSKLLSSTLLMATTTIIPQTKTGNMLKIGLIITSVANMSKVIKTSTKESKVTTHISKIDYSDNIKSSLENINDMDIMINNSLSDIKYMKQLFKSEFEQYKDCINEYTSMLTKLDSIEKELIVKQHLAKTYESKLNEIKEKNNVKVKRLEE